MTKHAYVRRHSMVKFKECNLEWEQQQMRVTLHLTAYVRHNSVASTHEQKHISMQMDDGLEPAAKATHEFQHKEMSSFSLVTLFTLSLPQKSKTEDGKKQQAATERGWR